MSMIQKYMQLEAEAKALEQRLADMKSDARLQSEMEFKEKLEALMREFDKSAADVIQLLNPNPTAKPAGAGTTGRRKRKLKVYKNPNTGEVIETRGGNHKALKAWKEEAGADVVETWLVDEKD